jgi:thiol-disulfide isomerase/thioredoxin
MQRIAAQFVAAGLVFWLATLDAKADTKDPPEPWNEITIRLLDSDGKPVEGAHVGLMGGFNETRKTHEDTDESGFEYSSHARSDANGRALVRFQHANAANFLKRYGIIIARDSRRGLVALAAIEPAQLGSTLDLHLVPECRVSGKLISPDLAKKGRTVTWSNVYLYIGQRRAMWCISKHAEFHFNLPPGQYRLNAYGAGLYTKVVSITVRPGQRQLTVEPLALPAFKLVRMEGLPAPDLREVAAWKNGRAQNVSDLKGKVIVLDFWGYWCNPCVARMPWLFKLHDQYAKDGLVVIGVHLDAEGEPPIDTVKKFDEKLAPVRKELWKGRDLPFPVALIRAHPVPFGPLLDPRIHSHSLADADYGIDTYGTLVLINRAGNVVGEMEGSDEGIALLKKTLAQRPPADAAAK